MKIVSAYLLIVILFATGVVFGASNPPTPTPPEAAAKKEDDASKRETKPQPNKTVTSWAPTIVETSKAPVAHIEATEKHKETNGYSSSEWWLVYLTGALAAITAVLASYTGFLYRATVALGREAKTSGETQSDKMERSITEATRAAAAMEQLARSSAENIAAIREVTAQQMRAYLIVSIGNGIYQEREKGLKFEVKPKLFNAGHTPAHKMTYWARAEILPFPLPGDFVFSIHETAKHSMLLGPHQDVEISAIVDDFVRDEEVADIKLGNNKRVHIWGIVTYTDVFDEIHTTKFCHSIRWFGAGENEKITGTYNFYHNEAT